MDNIIHLSREDMAGHKNSKKYLLNADVAVLIQPYINSLASLDGGLEKGKEIIHLVNETLDNYKHLTEDINIRLPENISSEEAAGLIEVVNSLKKDCKKLLKELILEKVDRVIKI